MSPPHPPTPGPGAHQHPGWRTNPAFWVAAGLLALAAAWFLPAWMMGSEGLLGASESDAIRGAWGFDHVFRGLPDPIFTQRVNFPAGATVLPLPFFSALLLWPINAILGPWAGYTLAVTLLLWLAGFAVAWSARELAGSWTIGVLAGATFMAQPMLLHAINDGTPEHLAIWTLPACWAALLRAQRTGSARWSALAGLLATGLALDSPYALVFGLVLTPFAAPAMLSRLRQLTTRRKLAATLPALLLALTGLALAYALYASFTLQPPDTALSLNTALAGNSVDLRSWWMQENRPEADILGTLAPALIPTTFLITTLLLALVGLPRSLPWLAAACLGMILSLGTLAPNAGVLAWWGQAAGGENGRALGQHLGDGILAFNAWWTQQPLLAGIRFPRRWLVPTALALCLGASCGLAACIPWLARLAAGQADRRTGRRAPALIGLLLAVILAGGLAHNQRYRDALPIMDLPAAPFAHWLGTQAPPGAVILFPTVRPAPDQRVRARVPVYANLGASLASADHEYFQLIHHRPILHHPSLLTVQPRDDLATSIRRLIQDTNDLTVPHFVGTDPPGSAVDPRRDPERAAGRAALRQAGACCVVFDLGVYDDPWLSMAVDYYAPIATTQRFFDGDGVFIAVME